MLWPSLRQRTVNRVLVNPICINSRDHDLVGEPNGRSYSKSIRILNFGFVMWKMDDRSTEIDSSSNVSDEENDTTGKILMFYDWITLYWWCDVLWCALANFSKFDDMTIWRSLLCFLPKMVTWKSAHYPETVWLASNDGK